MTKLTLSEIRKKIQDINTYTFVEYRDYAPSMGEIEIMRLKQIIKLYEDNWPEEVNETPFKMPEILHRGDMFWTNSSEVAIYVGQGLYPNTLRLSIEQYLLDWNKDGRCLEDIFLRIVDRAVYAGHCGREIISLTEFNKRYGRRK